MALFRLDEACFHAAAAGSGYRARYPATLLDEARKAAIMSPWSRRTDKFRREYFRSLQNEALANTYVGSCR